MTFKHFACLFGTFFLSACATWGPSQPNILREFTTDGCSLSPNGVPGKPNALLGCCIQHDFAYWKGGSFDERQIADQQLRSCVSKASNDHVGNVYYYGVRLGGSPIFKTDFHWGYGWSKDRPYGTLSGTEQKQVEAQSSKINWDAILSKVPKN